MQSFEVRGWAHGMSWSSWRSNSDLDWSYPAQNKLGGGEGVEGLYGSITQQGMQKVLDCLQRNTGLDQRSVFIDIGAGLGRPMLHAMVAAGVTSAWGVELDRVKCNKAAAFCGHVMENLVAKGLMAPDVPVPPVRCAPVEEVSTLDPATHAYSFWEGVPTEGKLAFGELFASSRSLRAVAVVQRAMRGEEPAAVMRELGFGPVLLIASFPVKMSGSGRSFTAYVFSKIAPAAANFLASAAGAGTVAAASAAAPAAVLPAAVEPKHLDARQRQQEEGPEQDGPEQGAAPAAAAAAGPRRSGRPPSRPASGGITKVETPPKARKQADLDVEPAPSSPPKKACTGSPGSVARPAAPEPTTAVGVSGRGAAVARRIAAEAEKGAGAGGALTAAAPAPRPLAAKQVLLTSLPEYSRRTKQGAAVGKAVAGKPAAGASAPASAGTRSSQRLASKAQAAAVVPSAQLLEGH
ncbi:hypothetical protein GPECTOR_17g857 [Gonium pectorale]|uniref:DOT1 domain-containing protein n=1 Tax=Gonium pectorale TaxID=33097 RepID=A0A150GLM8_GONPE|nr:hypothetical protein GPECTOR_17g857 [Gonium pectorale]|eukprot:KXZ50220.1 hypothetical protein GPECTOR_17g857 [Gonium pectorale]